ncbi:hypothetical protein [Streptomyces sp. NPDC049040]|uniref:hypothetical protein n=1 Tax=Streptomyces sp. NPDC049040 TaxID=3365593 RepID=UPI003712B148
MRRILVVVLSVSALLASGAASATAGTTPAGAVSSVRPNGGWLPEPIPPFDAAAGVLCDFPVHWDVVENQVRTKIVATYPDGNPKRQLAAGALLLNVSNAATGVSTQVDAGGSALIDYGTDGSMVWHVVGPVIARLPEGSSNLARGLYAIDGVYRIAFSPTGFKTVTLVHGTVHNLCTDLDQ